MGPDQRALPAPDRGASDVGVTDGQTDATGHDGFGELILEKNHTLMPQVRASTNGLLATTLAVDYATTTLGSINARLRNYEGGLPGPTLRLKAGDTLKLKLKNELPPNTDPVVVNHNKPHRPNSTNLHTHGLHVDPTGASDNILLEVTPGQEFDYQFDVPVDHPGGTFFYHPHKHGSVALQVFSGLAGALIIEGAADEVPEIAAAEDILLVINELTVEDDGDVSPFETSFLGQEAHRFFTVNGKLSPTLRMQPGEVQRWRLIHAGANKFLRISLADHVLQQIAIDGIGLAHSRTLPDVELGSGMRCDVMIQAGKPGTYDLLALTRPGGETITLAKVVIEGDPVAMNLPTTLPTALKDIEASEVTNQRTISFDVNMVPSADTAPYPQFKMDNKFFDPERIDHQVMLGAVEEWTITNNHAFVHSFHIHTNPFQVIKVNDQAVEPTWMDTVILEGLTSVTFRIRFEDFTGIIAAHCHVLDHEELGMMQLVEIISS